MTTTPQFDVWFDGKLAAGTDATAVCRELMAVFGINESQALTPVSYTHLTLPTKA